MTVEVGDKWRRHDIISAMQSEEQYLDIPLFHKTTREYVRVDLLFAIIMITLEISGFERRRETLPESLGFR